MPTIRIPLVGSLIDRNVDTELADAVDQKFTNCFPEVVKNPVTGAARLFLHKRPGRAQSAAVQASAAGSAAAHTWSSNSAVTAPAVLAFQKSTGTAMMFFDSNGSQIGGDAATTSSALCTFLSDTVIGTTGNLTAAIYDGSTPEAWFFPEGGAWTQITDGDFPANVQPVHCHMDGYMFVITSAGAIYNSDLNSLSAWTATSFITAQSMPDNGIAVARYKNLVAAFGDYSTEFFYNAGNATGSPLNPVANATLRIGATRRGVGFYPSVRSIMNTIYWLGRNADSGTCGVYRLNGFQAEKVSNTTVDKLVTKGVIISILGAFTLGGMSHIAFNSLGLTVLCFCVDTSFWWYLETDVIITALTGNLGTSGITNFVASSNARVHSFDPNTPVWQDAGGAYTQTVQTDKIDLGTDKRKFFKSLRLIGDTQSATSNVGVSWSDDDYATFSTAVNVDMSVAEKATYRLGMSRRRAFKFTHAANTANRMEAFELDYEVGAN